jgi:dipeptidase D
LENILKSLRKEKFFEYFGELTAIPRESGNEKAVSDYLVDFAKKNGLEVIQENCLNVIIKKPATLGYEDSKTVILQGHMDMVCVKEDDKEFDFSKDPIPVIIDGDYIKTEGTTLGADNGIAVAMAMDILSNKEIKHPPIVALITVNEESGMSGVMELDAKNISGEILINLDSEEEGIALCSCAGGIRNSLEIPVLFNNKLSNEKILKVKIKGLLGGHSGAEIHKNRANGIKLLGRMLNSLKKEIEFDLIALSGGDKMNAIAKSAEAFIAVESNLIEKLNSKINDVENIFKSEFAVSDSGISIEVENVDNYSGDSMDKKSMENVINALVLMPFGVQTMSSNIDGLVESSTNIGVLSTNGNIVSIDSAIRSSVKTLKYEILHRIDSIAELIGGKSIKSSEYPEWQFREESEIREIMKRVYFDMYKKEFKIDAIHAGLECGFLEEKLGKLVMISIGPEMWDVHTPYERLSISSSIRLYEFLINVLEQIK